MKRIIALLLIVAACVMINTNAAAGEPITMTFETYGYWGDEVTLLSEGVSEDTKKLLEERLYKAALNRETDVDVYDLNIKVEDREIVGDILAVMSSESPEIFYLKNGYSVKSKNNIVSAVTLTYNAHAEEKAHRDFYSKVDYIIASVVDEAMSDAEKALALHDYIINNTTYTYDKNVDRTKHTGYIDGDVHNPYGVIIYGVGVCQGYARTYNLLLKRVGIETMYVRSTVLVPSHAWSLIKIDGKWYHADITWDDPITLRHPYDQIVNHENFLLSDEGIIATGHTGWNTVTPECDDKKYEAESYSFFGTQTEMKYHKGKYHYMKYIKVDEPVYDGTCVTDGENYYLIRYLSSRFDGSDTVCITEDEYNNMNTEFKNLYYPIKYNEGVAERPEPENFNNSQVFIKGFNSVNEKIYVACFDKDNVLIGFAKATDTGSTTEYCEFKITDVPDDTEAVKLMYWNKNKFIPVDENIVIE